MRAAILIVALTACGTTDGNDHADAPLCDTFINDLTYLTVHPTRSCVVSLADVDYVIFTSPIPGGGDPSAVFISGHDAAGHQEQAGPDTRINDNAYNVTEIAWHGETGKAVVLDTGAGVVERCQWVRCEP